MGMGETVNAFRARRDDFCYPAPRLSRVEKGLAPLSKGLNLGLAMAAALVSVAGLTAQSKGGSTLTLTVRETAGIRRTEYPVSTRISFTKGAVPDAGHLRLRRADADMAAQFTPVARWEDGSLRSVDLDFNTSIGAGESRSLRIEVDATATASAAPRGALDVTENGDGIKVGSITLGRHAWPLLASVAYRGEIIGVGQNGFSLTDSAGGAYAFGAARDVHTDIVKRGPLLVVVRYAGTLDIGAGISVPVTITCELPNSKSWIKTSIEVSDPQRRVHGIRLETPFALGPFPWTWDVGSDSGTYGSFRAAGDRTIVTQRVTSARVGHGWKVETGSGTDLGTYEQSVPGRAERLAGWGHLLDARNAVAFAIDRFGSVTGTYTMTLDGQGRAAFELQMSRPTTRSRLVVYQHYVSTPVPIGAATSPAAMLQPLIVDMPK